MPPMDTDAENMEGPSPFGRFERIRFGFWFADAMTGFADHIPEIIDGNDHHQQHPTFSDLDFLDSICKCHAPITCISSRHPSLAPVMETLSAALNYRIS